MVQKCIEQVEKECGITSHREGESIDTVMWSTGQQRVDIGKELLLPKISCIIEELLVRAGCSPTSQGNVKILSGLIG